MTFHVGQFVTGKKISQNSNYSGHGDQSKLSRNLLVTSYIYRLNSKCLFFFCLVCMYVCLSVCLSIRLSYVRFVCLSICLSINLYYTFSATCISWILSLCHLLVLSVCLFVCLSICMSVNLSIYYTFRATCLSWILSLCHLLVLHWYKKSGKLSRAVHNSKIKKVWGWVYIKSPVTA